MSASPKDWLDSFDRVITKPGRYGVFGLGIASVVYAAIYYEWIDSTLFEGKIKSYVGFAIAVSISLTIYGLLFLIWKFVGWIINLINEWCKRRLESEKLLENIRIIGDSSLVMLLLYLKQPSGRFQAPGRMTAFDQLITYDLIEEDYDHFKLVYTDYSRGTPFRVNPLLYKHREKVITELTSRLSVATGIDLSKDGELLARYRIITSL